MTELPPGTLVGDRYIVKGVIGSGGMAIVYKVTHRDLGSTHALKLLRTPNKRVRSRLLQEGRLQAELVHPNIVGVTDQVEVDGMPGLIMEYVRGPSLSMLLERRPLTLEQADMLALGILAGVGAAHAAGVTHRDLKPANVLLEVTPTQLIAKVTDFGLAKAMSREESGHSTRAGVPLGTPRYMAPEQFDDAKNVDQRADVWSLGALLYEMVTNKPAFGGKDAFDIARRIEIGKYRGIRRIVPSVPDRMERAIQGALVPDLDERVATVEGLTGLWLGNGRKKKAPGKPALEAAAELANKTGQLSALAAVVHRTMGDAAIAGVVGAGDRPAKPKPPKSGAQPAPLPARSRGPDIQTLQLEEDQVFGIEPMPLDVDPDTEYEGEDTVIHRIRREYGILAAVTSVVLTGLFVVAVGLVLLWAVLSVLDSRQPTGPSLDQTIDAPR